MVDEQQQLIKLIRDKTTEQIKLESFKLRADFKSNFFSKRYFENGREKKNRAKL